MKKDLTLKITLGFAAPSLKSQLKVFDFVPDEEIKFLQKLSESIGLLAFHNVISESQKIRCFEKLIKRINKTILKYAKDLDNENIL
jgi:hypothetical protein